MMMMNIYFGLMSLNRMMRSLRMMMKKMKVLSYLLLTVMKNFAWNRMMNNLGYLYYSNRKTMIENMSLMIFQRNWWKRTE